MSEESTAIDGGEGGGAEKLVLKRSELLILRRMADKYPLVPAERQELVDIAMDMARTSRSRRTKLAAIKTIVLLDRTNHDEVKVYLDSQKKINSDLQPAVIVNNQVIVQTTQTVLDEYADVITRGRVKASDPENDHPAKQVHSPETNGKAG